MVFIYDPNKLNEFKKDSALTLIPMLILSIVIVLPVLYFQMQEIENALLIITITFIMMIASGFIGALIRGKKAKTEFNSYKIELNDYDLTISSKMFDKKIKFDQINRIYKDSKNNIYIVTNKINKTKILCYIENIEKFESISPIEQNKSNYNFLQFLPVILFVSLTPISRIASIELYLIFAFAVLLTTAYALVKTFMDQIRLRHKIIGVVIDLFVLIAVGRNIYIIIDYIRV